jgi:two-component system sensor histidine kinase/response regulator
LMDGEMGVDSKPGQGSRFWFRLPADVLEAAPPMPEPLPANIHLLIVDDNARSRANLSEIASRLGAIVSTATCGVDGMTQLTSAAAAGEPFDLLLIDEKMPGVDGFEVARHGRKTSPPPVMVMMLGASDLHTTAAESRRLGLEQYVVKPIFGAELVGALHRALTGTRNELPANAFVPQIRPANSVLNVLLAEDNVVNQKLTTRLLEKMGHRFALARDGAEAVHAHAAGHFDVILMDVQMPEMNGFEATAQIREREKRTGEHVPIIALTAHAIQGDRDRCIAAGMDDYLSKPLNAVALAEKLETLARKSVLVG